MISVWSAAVCILREWIVYERLGTALKASGKTLTETIVGVGDSLVSMTASALTPCKEVLLCQQFLVPQVQGMFSRGPGRNGDKLTPGGIKSGLGCVSCIELCMPL